MNYFCFDILEPQLYEPLIVKLCMVLSDYQRLMSRRHRNQ